MAPIDSALARGHQHQSRQDSLTWRCGRRDGLGRAIGSGAVGVVWCRGGYSNVESRPGVADRAAPVGRHRIPDLRPRHESVPGKHQDRQGGRRSWLTAAADVRNSRARRREHRACRGGADPGRKATTRCKSTATSIRARAVPLPRPVRARCQRATCRRGGTLRPHERTRCHGCRGRLLSTWPSTRTRCSTEFSFQRRYRRERRRTPAKPAPPSCSCATSKEST